MMDDAGGAPAPEPGTGSQLRRGSWADEGRSTYDLCLERIAAERWEDAAELARATVHEAREPHELYRDWIGEIGAYLTERGVSPEFVDARRDEMLEGLRWPDGTPFDAEAGWARMCDAVERAVRRLHARDGFGARACIEDARQRWLDTHDRKCDLVQGMVALVSEQLGEAAVGPLWDLLMAPMFDGYDCYDVDRQPWSVSAATLLQVTAEALRGHLSGPGRRGEIEYVREEGRRGFRFAPCGSGGRNFTGETLGTYPLTTERHDWAWNTVGVCLYCAHCCALSERNPIRRYGYPARVVEPPFRDSEGERTHCTWWVYDDPAAVPDEVYRRTGNRKPAEIGGRATRTRGGA